MILPTCRWIDSVNHPGDHGRGYEIVGHLRFVRIEGRPAADDNVRFGRPKADMSGYFVRRVAEIHYSRTYFSCIGHRATFGRNCLKKFARMEQAELGSVATAEPV